MAEEAAAAVPVSATVAAQEWGSERVWARVRASAPQD
jgi:hypothetical protein